MSTPRALTFGSVAENYERYRPTYPDRLVTDVVALLPGSRLLEIGAGTGKATRLFAAAGCEIECIEPDPDMAGVLRRHYPGPVTVSTFEAWSAGRSAADAGYDGLICAQAWHWTEAETRWRNAAAALAPGGLLALFWNGNRYADPASRQVIAGVYEKYGVDDHLGDVSDTGESADWPDSEIAASSAAGFANHQARLYRWADALPVADHVARITTHSAHLILPPDVQTQVRHELIDGLTTRTGPTVHLAMRTYLALARRL